LYQKTESEEDAIKFAKIGLLTMPAVSLEKEVADLAERIDESKKTKSCRARLGDLRSCWERSLQTQRLLRVYSPGRVVR